MSPAHVARSGLSHSQSPRGCRYTSPRRGRYSPAGSYTHDANEQLAFPIDGLLVKGGALLLSSESKGSPLIEVTTFFTLQEGSQLKLDNLGRVHTKSLQVLPAPRASILAMSSPHAPPSPPPSPAPGRN